MTKVTHPDTRYIEALVSNDSVLIKEIYRDYFPRIKALILRNNGKEDDAYDIFQDSLMVIFHKGKDPNFVLTASFYAFLYGISSRLWLKELRKRYGKEVTFSEELEFTDDFDLESAITHKEQRNLIREKFGQLRERCRKILELTIYEGKSHAEVAEIMGFANANVSKKEKAKCKKRLVDLIKKDPRYKELR